MINTIIIIIFYQYDYNNNNIFTVSLLSNYSLVTAHPAKVPDTISWSNSFNLAMSRTDWYLSSWTHEHVASLLCVVVLGNMWNNAGQGGWGGASRDEVGRGIPASRYEEHCTGATQFWTTFFLVRNEKWSCWYYVSMLASCCWTI